MGILGEYSMEDLRDQVLAEAANYEAADPSRPVIPAFELIATVAQPTPGADGTYILDTDLPTLTEYADFAEANDMLVFLDLQIGPGDGGRRDREGAATARAAVRPSGVGPGVRDWGG